MKVKINYKEKKFLTEEETSKSELEFMVNDTKLQLESAINATQRDLSKAQILLVDLKQSYPLELQQIIDTQLEVDALQDGLNKLNTLKTELGFA